MKLGKWNYTENMQYRVVIVELLPDPKTPMSWANAFVGQQCQAVEVNYEGHDPFYIDNEDGSGLLKIHYGGGPGSYSAHISNFNLISEVDEADWQQFDLPKHAKRRFIVDLWQEKNFPEEYAKLERLRKSLKSMQSQNPIPASEPKEQPDEVPKKKSKVNAAPKRIAGPNYTPPKKKRK